MRYYNGLLKLQGYEICSLRDLVSDRTSSEIIDIIDKIILHGIDNEHIIFDSRTIAQYEFNTGICIVNGNRGCKNG